MKRLLYIFSAIILLSLTFSSCSKDDFDYPMETLYGTWDATDMKIDGDWIDVTEWPYSKLGASITFYSDGSYYGKGALGTGKGTYEAKGNQIFTYVAGEIYLTYTIISLNNYTAHFKISDKSGEVEMKAKKK